MAWIYRGIPDPVGLRVAPFVQSRPGTRGALCRPLTHGLPMKRWILRLYAPLCLSAFVVAAIVWVGHHHGNPLWLLALLALALAIAVSFVAERLWPYDPAFNHDHGDTPSISTCQGAPSLSSSWWA